MPSISTNKCGYFTNTVDADVHLLADDSKVQKPFQTATTPLSQKLPRSRKAERKQVREQKQSGGEVGPQRATARRDSHSSTKLFSSQQRDRML